MCVVFPKLPHQPLDKNELANCVKDFAKYVVEAVKQLHVLGYCHQDIRLPNVCFSADYCATLIDFDRVDVATTESKERDWYDLSQVLKLCHSSSEWAEACDTFVLSLISGNVNYDHLQASWTRNVSLATVLCDRS